MLIKIIVSICLLLCLIGLVLILPQLVVNNKITDILCKIGLILILVIGVMTSFFSLGVCFYKLWGVN